MSDSYDVIVVGLGAMGSAAAYQLARKGRRVLGLDRYTPPHAHGSSHGRTRIIREAYFEHPAYVPLVQRAYRLWGELEELAGRKLLQTTGGLMIGRPDGVLVSGALRSAHQHGLRHELLDAPEVRERFPALRPDDGMVAVWEPRAGILFPESCIEAHLKLAQAHGATFRYGEPLIEWRMDDARGAHVITDKGEYRAEKLLLTAGAWMPSLLPGLLPLTIERQVQYWFAPRHGSQAFSATSCPIHLWEPTAAPFFYGLPDLGDGVKIAVHHGGETIDPDQLSQNVGDDEIAVMRDRLRQYLPEADGALLSTAVCMYANTPDEHFWIDRHPEHAQVLIASACSGHGFKFSSVIGEVLAELLVDGRSRFDLALFARR